MRRLSSDGRIAWFILVLSVVACLASVIRSGYFLSLSGRVFVDWVTYSNAVDRLFSGRAIFSPEQLVGPYSLPNVVRIGYAYPPPSVVLFLPFASLPIGLLGWIVLNVGILVTGLFAAIRKELGSLSPLTAAVTLIGLAAFVPFTEGVAAGNVNVAMAGVLAWAWVLGRSRLALGPISGLAAVIKIVPGAMVFWSERQRFLRAATTAIAVAAGLTIVTLPMTGLGAWRDMFTALSNSQPFCPAGIIHPSIACLVTPFAGATAGKAIGILVGIALGLAALFTKKPLYAFALVCFSSLAPVADAHSHTFVVLYVLLAVAIAQTVGMWTARVEQPTQSGSGASTTITRAPALRQ